MSSIVIQGHAVRNLTAMGGRAHEAGSKRLGSGSRKAGSETRGEEGGGERRSEEETGFIIVDIRAEEGTSPKQA